MILDVDGFDQFCRDVNGHRPFSWQMRLIEFLLEYQRWPDRIDAPTGSGKTAVIDAHVYAFAATAIGTDSTSARRLPRRLALVVDRRALVDEQFQRATDLARMLRSTDEAHAVAHEVRRRLLVAAGGSSNGPDLEVIRTVLMRGAVPSTIDWRNDPLRCTIICATPAMWGSRLLLRGFGTSRRARPHEGGLLAYDAVVVVDEAHLARQLVYSARRVGEQEAHAQERLPVPVLQVTEVSATPSGDPGPRASVGVRAEDLAGDIDGIADRDGPLRRRLLTPKPLALVAVPWPARSGPSLKILAGRFADRALDAYQRHGRTVACVANTVRLALEIGRALDSRFISGRPVRVLTLVGGMRPWDIGQIRSTHAGLFTPEGDPTIDVVVATQTIEVGVDMDFAALITELAPASAIVQRSGRVNRLGLRVGEVAVIVPEDDSIPDTYGPYVSDELQAGLAWLRQRATDPTGLAPWSVALDRPPEAALRRQLLLRMEAWDSLLLARTDQQLVADPDVELWLADDLEADTDVSVIFRQPIVGADGQVDDIATEALLRATPPVADEAYQVRVSVLRSLVEAHLAAQQQNGSTATESEQVAPSRLYVVAGPDEVAPCQDLAVISGGITMVAPAGAHWIHSGIVHEGPGRPATDVHDDVAPEIERVFVGSPGCRDHRHDATVRDLLAEVGRIDADPDLDRDEGIVRVVELVRGLHRADPETDPVQQPRATAGALDYELGPRGRDGIPTWVVLRPRRGSDDDERLAQEASTTRRAPILLDAHHAEVAMVAGSIASALGLGNLRASLVAAAGDHDLGKRYQRFQASLGRRPGDVLYAKSGMRDRGHIRRMRARSGLLPGWRHEQLSAADSWSRRRDLPAEERDLVVRLVGTSHGHGRAVFRHGAQDLVGDQDAAYPAALELFDEGAWSAILERTHERFGVWGCAYLEALVRAADCSVSGDGG